MMIHESLLQNTNSLELIIIIGIDAIFTKK